MSNDFGMSDLTGRWLGFYRYRSEEMGMFPITAEVRQSGRRIVGEMYDQVTERSELLDTLLDRFREDLTPRARVTIEAGIALLGTREIEVRTHLPDAADIDGVVDGDRIRFTKTYRGSYEAAWWVADRLVGAVERRRHRVQYSGQLDRERGMIVGQWTIRKPGPLGWLLPPEGRGAFELYRKS
jgi:hypothetical protein